MSGPATIDSKSKTYAFEIENMGQVKALEDILGMDFPESIEKRLIGGEIAIDNGYNTIYIRTSKSDLPDAIKKWDELVINGKGISTEFVYRCDAGKCHEVATIVEFKNGSQKTAKKLISAFDYQCNGFFTTQMNEIREAFGLPACNGKTNSNR